jgi:hypothetical protein
MSNYEAILVIAKCENCGEEQRVLIPTNKIESYLSKKENKLKTAENN